MLMSLFVSVYSGATIDWNNKTTKATVGCSFQNMNNNNKFVGNFELSKLLQNAYKVNLSELPETNQNT